MSIGHIWLGGGSFNVTILGPDFPVSDRFLGSTRTCLVSKSLQMPIMATHLTEGVERQIFPFERTCNIFSGIFLSSFRPKKMCTHDCKVYSESVGSMRITV